MTDAQAKRVGMTAARKWLLFEYVPQVDTAIRMLIPGEQAEESPSWQDIVDVDSMFIQDGVLHVDAKIKPVKAVDWIDFNFQVGT